jgi:hypothetical protein
VAGLSQNTTEAPTPGRVAVSPWGHHEHFSAFWSLASSLESSSKLFLEEKRKTKYLGLPVISQKNSIRVHHWDYLEGNVFTQGKSYRVTANQEVDQT